jgi:hypothetical protein
MIELLIAGLLAAILVALCLIKAELAKLGDRLAPALGRLIVRSGRDSRE